MGTTRPSGYHDCTSLSLRLGHGNFALAHNRSHAQARPEAIYVENNRNFI